MKKPKATSIEGPSRVEIGSILAMLPILCAILLGPVSCRNRSGSESLAPRAEFGIFYGGQIQQRDKIPFELDRTQQVHGFRLTFPVPLEVDQTVCWELDLPRRPGRIPALASKRPEPRSQTETALDRKPSCSRIARGGKHFEKSFHFSPGDPLGVWNIRITLVDRLILDRPFLVYDPFERQRLIRSRDAGAR